MGLNLCQILALLAIQNLQFSTASTLVVPESTQPEQVILSPILSETDQKSGDELGPNDAEIFSNFRG